jgi:hypothetical protein
MTWTTVGPSLITAVVAFVGIGFGSRLSGRRETLNWTRDQRLKAYVELLTATNKCYGAFQKIADTMKELDYPADVRDNPKVNEAIEDWRKWYDEIDRCLAFADLVSSERFREYRPRINYGWRSYQQALIIDIVRGTPTKREEGESVKNRTADGKLSVRNTLGPDLTRIDSLSQRASDRLWPLRRRLIRIFQRGVA